MRKQITNLWLDLRIGAAMVLIAVLTVLLWEKKR